MYRKYRYVMKIPSNLETINVALNNYCLGLMRDTSMSDCAIT